jgi:hypothetical protein
LSKRIAGKRVILGVPSGPTPSLSKPGLPGTRSASSQSFRTNSNFVKTNSNFVKLDGPAMGAIAVYWRTSPNSGLGHVGFYMGETDTQISTLGGNESDAVRIQFEPRMQLIGYWWPASLQKPPVQVIQVDAKDGHPVGSVV